jgi:hypothetical protein
MTKERWALLIRDMQHITGMDGREQPGRRLSSLDSAAIEKEEMILATDDAYFPTQHEIMSLCNGDRLCEVQTQLSHVMWMNFTLPRING